jgi:hypothetical protein
MKKWVGTEKFLPSQPEVKCNLSQLAASLNFVIFLFLITASVGKMRGHVVFDLAKNMSFLSHIPWKYKYLEVSESVERGS